MLNQQTELDDHEMRGLCTKLAVRPGFDVLTADVAYQTDGCRSHSYDQGCLRLHYRLEGYTEVCEQGSDLQPMESGHVSLLVHAADTKKRERVWADHKLRAVTLICERDFAFSMLERNATTLPSFVNDFVTGREPRFAIASLPMAPQLRTVVQDILDPSMSGQLGLLMVEAKALELFCLTMRQFADRTRTSCVRPQDLKRVKEICALLNDPSGAQMTVRELCRAVAWNETKMTESFKQVTGTTISNFRHQVRMEMARRQLVEGSGSITEIAFDAGYEHPSNFATAFKRTFGYSPTSARLQLRPA